MEQRPVILSTRGLSHRIGEQILLNGVALTVHQGERIGVVGRNGAGKSTLLRILAGQMQPDDGVLEFRKGLVVSYLSQEVHLENCNTVQDAIHMGAADVEALLRKYEARVASHSDANELHELELEIEQRDGWNLNVTIDKLRTGLRLPAMERNLESLSGGEKRRVALAQALVGVPDLLLLDEPTNHLDIETIIWLEDFLNKSKYTCMFVTHDRHFLDNVSTGMLEVNDGNLFSYEGNYTDYLVAKAQREQELQSVETKRQRFLRNEIEWVRSGVKARTTKSQARLDRFYEEQSRRPPPKEEDVELVIPRADRLSARVLDIENVSIGYGDVCLIRNFSYCFQAGDRIGITGPNGAGKTTLLKMLMGELLPSQGEIVKGERTYFNYIDQHRLQLNDENDVLTEIADGEESVDLGGSKISVWAYLRRFLFTDERIKTPVGRLSGGERNRLVMAKIFRNGGNFLILDEPTNDLDLATLRVLEEALITFSGCVVVVSHDRFFLNRICTGIIAFEGDGNVFSQKGNYDYYMEKYLERRRIQDVTSKELTLVQKTSVKKNSKGLSWKEKRELENMENAVLEAEEQVQDLENIFAAPDFFQRYGAKQGELTEQLSLARIHAEKLYERWMELEEKARE